MTIWFKDDCKMFDLPTPHGDKLRSLLDNSKLPESDKSRVEHALEQYGYWIARLSSAEGSVDDTIRMMVALLNEYKLYIDIELIFDSDENFLYRQKGQLKLDSSVLEEFIPILVTTAFSEELKDLDLSFGPVNSFASLRFEENVRIPSSGAGMAIRSKAQDFAISRKLYISASHNPDFQESVTSETNLAYIATEIKTNLDKTMFQEATATALDVKSVAPGTRYYLLCEWLDMTPISTVNTAIDEIIILRRAKRIQSNLRTAFATSAGRRRNRSSYVSYMTEHPLEPESFTRYLGHIRRLISDDTEETILTRGFF